jgi:aryl-alcohol dehydrogenase-like predicted oxidoreductase
MIRRNIPNTCLDVSSICLGTMNFGTPVGETEAIKLVHYALNRGVNFIDTANMYEGYSRVIGSAGGVAEEILGKALVGRRDQVVLATKVGMKVGNEPEDEGTSPAAISKHLELSLRRLATDFIDIYYLHKPDPKTPLVEILSALEKVIRKGKVRYYGISNYSAQQLAELLSVAEANGLPRPVICQPPLSLLKQDVIVDLLPLCEREEMAVAPYQVLQGGLLTGKYRRGETIPPDSRKAEKSGWVWDLTDELFYRLEEIEIQAKNAGLTMTQYSIRWVLSQPAVVAAILGVKRTGQLDEALAV